MAKLDKRTIERILNEASLKGMETNELSALEAELYNIKALKNMTGEGIEFDNYKLANKVLTINVNLDEIVKFDEVNWEYQLLDKENKISKNLVDMEIHGNIYMRYKNSIGIKFGTIHAEYELDEKNTYYDFLTGEMKDKEYLIKQCKNNDEKLIETIKAKLIDYTLLEKAGVKVHFELFYGHDYDGFYSIVTGKIIEAMNNLYFQSYGIDYDFLTEAMHIEKTIVREMENCIERAFNYFTSVKTSNLYKFAKERFIIAVSEELEEKLEECTEEGIDFLFALLNGTSESYYKKVLNRENIRLDKAYENL